MRQQLQQHSGPAQRTHVSSNQHNGCIACSDVVTQQLRSSGAAGSSQRQTAAASQGAWAPWSCVPVREGSVGSQPRVRAEVMERYIHPRDMKISGRLHLQLGQPVTLHFVAVDFMGCSAVLSKQQKRDLVERGLQLQAENGEL